MFNRWVTKTTLFLGVLLSAGCPEVEFCGDGVTQEGEDCDNGASNNGILCNADCSAPTCGDGFFNPDEECDDNNTTNGDGCSDSCALEICGNNTLDDGEECDDGDNDGTTCNADCSNPTCGDGFFNPGEECDDSNTLSNDGCSGDCQIEIPSGCGNGILEAPEECDTLLAASCDINCKIPRCGNGVVGLDQNGVPEQCDDANQINTDACRNTCQAAFCGDGVVRTDVQAGQSGFETCDDGNTNNADGCNSLCQNNSTCGNGVLESNEQCEDGNAVDGDGCSALCEDEVCGNGVVQAGEACDDGDAVGADGCNNDCTVTQVVQIAAGGGHTCVLFNDGNVKCWGENGQGQLGYGNTNTIGDNELPSSVGNVALGGPASQIAAGFNHTCALLNDGKVKCWGVGLFGQLGYGNNGNIGDNETPASVGFVNVGTVVQIAAGAAHTCAILTDGNVSCWGRGDSGQLGYGNTNNIGDNETPAGAGTVFIGVPALQIAAGNDHTCAALAGGNAVCWGAGGLGQLGHGSTNSIGDNETPASAGAIPVGDSVVRVTAGAGFTCAMLGSNPNAGDVKCWGRIGAGVLGQGSAAVNNVGDDEPASVLSPVSIGSSVSTISSSFLHSCVVLTNGNVKCWGDNAEGQLGYGNTNTIGDNESPGSVGFVNIGGAAAQITTAGAHTCALLINGEVRCWGQGLAGQLGLGNTNNIGDTEAPSSVGPVQLF